jgi:hypothetical protein
MVFHQRNKFKVKEIYKKYTCKGLIQKLEDQEVMLKSIIDILY